VTIIATAYDGSGNPVQNVPIIFSIDQTSNGNPLEGLVNGGAVQFTNNNGQAFDSLFTKEDPSNPANSVTVVATAATGLTGSVTVVVN
jgi:hypothetical protein